MVLLELTINEEVNSDENVNVSDNSSQKVNLEEDALQEAVKRLLRRSTRTRRELNWFNINTRLLPFTEEEPFVREALSRHSEEA